MALPSAALAPRRGTRGGLVLVARRFLKAALLVPPLRRILARIHEALSGSRLKCAAAAVALAWAAAKVVRAHVNANWSRDISGADTSRTTTWGLPADSFCQEDAELCSAALTGADESPEGQLLSRHASERSLGASCSAGLPWLAGFDGRSALFQSGALAALEESCQRFLFEHARAQFFGPGEVVFKQGDPVDSFLVVSSGSVVVAAAAGAQAGRSLDPGAAPTGLLQVLAALCGSGGGPCPFAPELHEDSGVGGPLGAEVAVLPAAVLQRAFVEFPQAMVSLAQTLCMRLMLVVWDTLFKHFDLAGEVLRRPGLAGLEATPSPKGSTKVVSLGSPSPQEAVAACFGCSGATTAGAAALANATVVERAAGELALAPDKRASHVFVLLEGDLRVTVEPARAMEEAKRGQAPVARAAPEADAGAPQVELGSLVGELSAFTNRPTPLVYRCRSSCRFAALPRDSFQQLLESQPLPACLRVLRSVAAISAPWLRRADALLEWLHVEAGRSVYRRGEPMKGFFVVLSGRLLVGEEQPRRAHDASSGHSHYAGAGVHQRGRGACCGVLDCLREMSEYSEAAYACRDTEVCRVSPVLLRQLAADFPSAILHFSTQVAEVRRLPPAVTGSAGEPVTICVVPADPTVRAHDACVRLVSALSSMGKTAHVSPHSDLSQGHSGPRLARVLAELEERCRWLVYEAEPAVTDWTRRCVRQADVVLVAVRFDGHCPGDAPPSPVERYVEQVARRAPHVDRKLLLIHEPAEQSSAAGIRRQCGAFTSFVADDLAALTPAAADLRRPGLRGLARHIGSSLFGSGRGRLRSTRHYLFPRPWARQWYHVRAEEGADWARCARLLVGQGVGLCLGGGGARGNVHFGVIRAMEELGIPIDAVSGTSFGALAAGIYAISASSDRGAMTRLITRVMGSSFSTRRMMSDINFPRTAYFTGSYLNKVLQEVFARRRCEDTLVPFACTSTDILNFEAKLHTEGPIWRVVRASMSLVGLVPPLPHQESRGGKVCSGLLVDGGYTNQYPTEELRQLGVGSVICVRACPDFEPVSTDYGDSSQGGAVALLRLLGVKWRWYRGPDPPPQSEIQERLMFLPDAMRGAESAGGDLLVSPPIQGYGLLEFSRFQDLEKIGYEEAMPQLREWLAGRSPASQQAAAAVLQGTVAGMSESGACQIALQPGYGERRPCVARGGMRKIESCPSASFWSPSQ